MDVRKEISRLKKTGVKGWARVSQTDAGQPVLIHPDGFYAVGKEFFIPERKGSPFKRMYRIQYIPDEGKVEDMGWTETLP